MQESLDQIVLNFDKDTLLLLNICIAIIMFGVALDLKVDHFKMLIKAPKSVILGVSSQFILLPFVTFLLITLVQPSPSVAIGMMLVAACPGGNVSNFYCSLSGGNVALSVSLTAISSLLSVIMTPLNFTFWANQYEPTAALLTSVDINVIEVITTVFIILIIPLTLGMYVNHKYPTTSQKIVGPIKKLSILIFSTFVISALAINFDYFTTYISQIILIVLAHNALGLLSGWLISKAGKLNEEDKRSITIETGIQNSGLALVIIFEFFDGLGGMAIIAAWWGVWHLISGALVSWYWSPKKDPVLS